MSDSISVPNSGRCAHFFTEAHSDRHGPVTYRKITRGNNGETSVDLCSQCANKIRSAWDDLVGRYQLTKHLLTGSAEGRVVYVVMNQNAMIAHDATTLELLLINAEATS